MSLCSVFNGRLPCQVHAGRKVATGWACHQLSGVGATGGFWKRWHFSHSRRQQKGMLKEESSGRSWEDKGTGEVSRALGLRSAPPPGGSPRGRAPARPANSSPPLTVQGQAAPKGLSHPHTRPTPAPAPSSQLLGGARNGGRRQARAADGGRVAGSGAVRLCLVAWLHSVALLMCIQVE